MLPLMCICVLQVYREAATLYARYDRSSRWSEWPSLRADLVGGGLWRKPFRVLACVSSGLMTFC
jgi:hypothetical protein